MPTLLFILLLCFSFPLRAQQLSVTAPSTSQVDQWHSEKPEVQEEEYHYGQEFLNMILNLVLLIGLVFAATWALKRFTKARVKQTNETHSIKIIDKRPLSQKATIYIIEVAGKTLLVGESAAGINSLAEIELPPIEEALEEPQEKRNFSFSEILKKKLNYNKDSL